MNSQQPPPPPGLPPGPPSEPPTWPPHGPDQPPQPGQPPRGLLRFGRGWLIGGLGGSLAIIIAVIVIITVGGGGSFTAHGTSQDCNGVESDGTQVVVSDSSQHVIGTGTLTTDNSTAAQKLETEQAKLQASLGQFGSGSSGMSIYDFTVSVPSGEARYGVEIGSGHGTVWFSEQEMRKGPGLNLGC